MPGVVGVLGRTDEDPRDDPCRRIADRGHASGDVRGGQPVQDGAVGLPPGQRQHLRPKRGQQDRHRLGRRVLQPESLDREGVEGIRRRPRRPGRSGRSAAHPGSCETPASKANPFQDCTIAGLDAPRPRLNRPGAAEASAAADWAISAGPRVNTGTIAVPRRSSGCQAAASASGVKASAPATSLDQTSVNPQPGKAETTSRCAASSSPVSGMVRPQLTVPPATQRFSVTQRAQHQIGQFGRDLLRGQRTVRGEPDRQLVDHAEDRERHHLRTGHRGESTIELGLSHDLGDGSRGSAAGPPGPAAGWRRPADAPPGRTPSPPAPGLPC